MIYKTRCCDARAKSHYFIKAPLRRLIVLKVILGIININVVLLLNFIFLFYKCDKIAILTVISNFIKIGFYTYVIYIYGCYVNNRF
jgi:hypothetical protein